VNVKINNYQSLEEDPGLEALMDLLERRVHLGRSGEHNRRGCPPKGRAPARRPESCSGGGTCLAQQSCSLQGAKTWEGIGAGTANGQDIRDIESAEIQGAALLKETVERVHVPASCGGVLEARRCTGCRDEVDELPGLASRAFLSLQGAYAPVQGDCSRCQSPGGSVPIGEHLPTLQACYPRGQPVFNRVIIQGCLAAVSPSWVIEGVVRPGVSPRSSLAILLPASSCASNPRVRGLGPPQGR